MPDRHKLKLFFKGEDGEKAAEPHARKFLGIHIGKHESQDLLASPTLTNSSDHQRTPGLAHHLLQQQHSPRPDDTAPVNKSHSMVELKRLFKPTRKPSAKGPVALPQLSTPPVHLAESSNPGLALHLREPLLTSLATLIQNTLSQLLHQLQHQQLPRRRDGPPQEPFTQDESPLVRKYGKVKRELGSGAGGLVRLIVRPLDGKTFAVKEFRPRRNTESLKEYTRKCTAEYCIGLTLKHPNIIKTIDIIHENNRYYEVMEYAPIDFFAVVMSGEMSRQEINCCLKQILQGISYLHSLGLAHRDLKLDNCVLTTDGILKIIDFGSAVIFKYPYDQYGSRQQDSVHYCHGIVGSDPYLAPEVLTHQNSYNPQPVDLWLIAIIYCCMTLKRFPWKFPNAEKDNSFKLYAMDDDNWHDYKLLNECHKLLLRQRHLKNLVARLNKKKKLLKQAEEDPQDDTDEKLKGLSELEPLDSAQTQLVADELAQIDEKLEEYENIKKEMKSKFAKRQPPPADDDADVRRSKSHKQIHGPYRLMRLLPHMLRPIIHKMLQIDSHKRATIEEILADEWIQSIECCTLKPATNLSEANIEEEDFSVLVRGKPEHEHTVVYEDDKEKEEAV